jgi:hypothetical protein
VKTEFTTTATTVATTMLIRTAPGTPRAIRTIISSRPRQKITIGQPLRWPSMPIRTGTVEPTASGVRVTKPAETRPTNAM